MSAFDLGLLLLIAGALLVWLCGMKKRGHVE
jgi:hypothetical protein